MNKYEIEKGKITLAGKPVPLEFGNKDQIKAIREFEEYNRALNHEGADICPTVELSFRFKCICGNTLIHNESFDTEIIEIDDIEPQHDCDCNSCNRSYSVTKTYNFGFVVRCNGFRIAD